jgi:hypothetical protein
MRRRKSFGRQGLHQDFVGREETMRHGCRLLRTNLLSGRFLINATKLFEPLGCDLVTSARHAGIIRDILSAYRLVILPDWQTAATSGDWINGLQHKRRDAEAAQRSPCWALISVIDSAPQGSCRGSVDRSCRGCPLLPGHPGSSLNQESHRSPCT